VKAFILLDSDKEGRDNKKSILDNQSDFYSNDNVFTLNDILPTLPSDSTIEDLLPIDFVKSFFDREMGKDFELIANKAVVLQLKNQSDILKTNKQKLDSLKMKLSIEFCSKFNSKSKLNALHNLILFKDKLISKIETFDNE
jgi:hypothetical protein